MVYLKYSNNTYRPAFTDVGYWLSLALFGSGVVACQPSDSAPQQAKKDKASAALIVAGSPLAGPIAQTAAPAAEHCDQGELNDLDGDEKFDEAFECGDELFETIFNELDGVGANVGRGQRFTRVPRADLNGGTEWLNHTPARVTGPNAENCNACHNQPADDGAGNASANVHRDPFRGGQLSGFIQRNTPHIFGLGALQRLAEEMTAGIQADRQNAQNAACAQGGTQTRTLADKGVNFGTISATRTGVNPCTVTFNTNNVQGVDADLIVRPYQWKGVVAFVRDFARGAGHNELGMQAVEIVNAGGVVTDGDFDGVVNEFTIGDMSALAVYMSAQPRPVTKIELADLGLMELTADERAAIGRGQTVFNQVGCNTCHTSSLTANDPVFSEPSQSATHRDALFPAGLNPVDQGVDPDNPIQFNLTTDQPDNVLDINGTTVHLGSFEVSGGGGAIIRLFGDLKRHDMGPGLAESVNEIPTFPASTGPSTFMTENLWGVGSTAPYLHDGRATTVMSAILEHGGEAANSRAAVQALSAGARADLVAFLENLILFKPDVAAAAEGEVTATLTPNANWTTGGNGTGGYCQNIVVTNNGSTPTTTWSVTLDLDGTTAYTSWNVNGIANGSSGTVTVTPCTACAWAAVIQPGASQDQLGFCANRNAGTAANVVATVTSASGTF